jgi:hypothetical protein
LILILIVSFSLIIRYLSNYFTLDAAAPNISKYSSIVAGIDNALGVQDADNTEPSSISATAPFLTAGTVPNKASDCNAFNKSSFP